MEILVTDAVSEKEILSVLASKGLEWIDGTGISDFTPSSSESVIFPYILVLDEEEWDVRVADAVTEANEVESVLEALTGVTKACTTKL